MTRNRMTRLSVLALCVLAMLFAVAPAATAQTTPDASGAQGDFAGLVDIGGRKMYLECSGQGSPTVPGCSSHSSLDTRVAPPSLIPYSSQICAWGKAAIVASFTLRGHGAPAWITWRSDDTSFCERRRSSFDERLRAGDHQLRLQLCQGAARRLQAMHELGPAPVSPCSDAARDRKRCAAQFPDQLQRLVAGQVPCRRVHFGGQSDGVAPGGQVFVSGRHGDRRAEPGPLGCR